MKSILLIAALAFSTLAFAQKKEIKKMDKAIVKGEYQKAQSIFQEIEENEVEEKFKADYTFYKAAAMIGNPNTPAAKSDQLQEVMILLDQAEEMGYEDKERIEVYKRATSNAVFKEAQELLAAGDQKGALKSVNFLVKLDPSNQGMREDAANIAYQAGDYSSAKANYQVLVDEGYTGIDESIVATDASSETLVNFPSMKAAEIAVATGEYKDARKDFSESRLGIVTTNLAWIYKNEGDMAAAKKLVADMQAKYPKDRNLGAAAADLYLILGEQDKYEEAINAMNEEIKDPKVFENLGIAAGEKENWDQAIQYYQNSIDLMPDNFVTQNNIAAAYINKGNLEQTTVEEQMELYTMATDHLEKVIELKPDLASAKQTLLGLYQFLKMDDKAAALKEKM